MKKYAIIFAIGGALALSVTACNNVEHSGGDHTDTVSMPAETSMQAPIHQDTITTPPADPAMDTSTPPAPKM